MKTKFLLFGVITLTAYMVTWANDDTDTEDNAQRNDSTTQSNIGAHQVRASNLIGTMIRNKKNEDIGKIDDLLFDKEDTTVHAVIAVHGFLGVDETLVTVPYSKLQVDNAMDYIIYDVTKEELETQPEFKYKPREVPWTDSDTDDPQ